MDHRRSRDRSPSGGRERRHERDSREPRGRSRDEDRRGRHASQPAARDWRDRGARTRDSRRRSRSRSRSPARRPRGEGGEGGKRPRSPTRGEDADGAAKGGRGAEAGAIGAEGESRRVYLPTKQQASKKDVSEMTLEERMQHMLGVSGFDTTQGKEVEENALTAARGYTRKNAKVNARQYMNKRAKKMRLQKIAPDEGRSGRGVSRDEPYGELRRGHGRRRMRSK